MNKKFFLLLILSFGFMACSDNSAQKAASPSSPTPTTSGMSALNVPTQRTYQVSGSAFPASASFKIEVSQ